MQNGGVSLPLSPSSKMLFDDPVLQRMEGDDSQPPSRLQKTRTLPEEGFEAGQFFVHGEAQGLEGAGGRMDAGAVEGIALDDLYQIPVVLSGRTRPAADALWRSGPPTALP
jgi:hypothetical protein